MAVVKGTKFLDRATTKGECLYFNLEDPMMQVDNCLKVLGYDDSPDSTDSKLHIVSKLFPSLDENIEALKDALDSLPGLRLIVIDVISKFIRRDGGVDDMNDTVQVAGALEKLNRLARAFPHVHIMCLAHCKKVQPDDPFDGILGSQSFRAETDTNMVIFTQGGDKLFAGETRTGVRINPTVLCSDVEISAGAQVIHNFSLGRTAQAMQESKTQEKEAAKQRDKKGEIAAYLLTCEDHTAPQEAIVKHLGGNRQDAINTVKELEEKYVLVKVAEKPLTYKLDEEAWKLHVFAMRAASRTEGMIQ